jgi:hypothetical protein
MQQSTFLEANNRLAAQEISRYLWNPKLHNLVQKDALPPPPDWSLSWANWV